jgi:hypothetical protein
MRDETPWGRFPDQSQHPAFAEAYGRLDEERRVAVDADIAAAADQMHALLGHALLEPLAWPGLEPRVARVVDMGERTCMAMGVFRLSIAGRLGTGLTTLSDGLDKAADNVDRRAIQLALTAMAPRCEALREVKPGDQSAYHRLLNHALRTHRTDTFEVAHLQTDLVAKLDLTLETGLKHGTLTSIVAHQEQIRRSIREGIAGVIHDLPLELAVALWLVALQGLGRVFGEDDKTLAYADYD